MFCIREQNLVLNKFLKLRQLKILPQDTSSNEQILSLSFFVAFYKMKIHVNVKNLDVQFSVFVLTIVLFKAVELLLHVLVHVHFANITGV